LSARPAVLATVLVGNTSTNLRPAATVMEKAGSRVSSSLKRYVLRVTVMDASLSIILATAALATVKVTLSILWMILPVLIAAVRLAVANATQGKTTDLE
jgi:Na+/H+ antiporter NhaA